MFSGLEIPVQHRLPETGWPLKWAVRLTSGARVNLEATSSSPAIKPAESPTLVNQILNT